MQIEIAHKNLHQKCEEVPEFKVLLAKALATRANIALRFEERGIRIALGDTRDVPTGIAVEGRWASPLLGTPGTSHGELLLLPYIFLIRALTISQQAIFSFGRQDRSICDFFMRNYLYAALRMSTLSIIESNDEMSDAVFKTSVNLTKGYTWIVRKFMPEPLFENRNGLELILAGAHIELFQFSNPTLQEGILRIQQASLENSKLEGGIIAWSEFAGVRSRVLAAMNST